MKRPPFRIVAAILLGGTVVLLVVGDLALRGLVRRPTQPVWSVAGDKDRGRAAIERYGCASCHVIPGIPGATGRVGPDLTGLPSQMYVGGVLPNTPRNLERWLLDPPAISPGTAMPRLGLTPEEARDVAAYLISAPR